MEKIINKTILSISVTIIIFLASGIGIMAKDALDKKANNETIIKVVEQIKEQRKEDREQRKEDKQDLKDQRIEQQEMNRYLLESIHMMLIDMVKEE